jgi:hypothetical protein
MQCERERRLLPPLAYIIFFILNNSKRYLGSDRFTGSRALIWNLGMPAALLASIASVCYYLYSHAEELMG